MCQPLLDLCRCVFDIFIPSGQVAFDLCNHTRTGIIFLMRAFGYYYVYGCTMAPFEICDIRVPRQNASNCELKFHEEHNVMPNLSL